MLPISFHPDVKKEIKDSFSWYQEQSPGLGHEFTQELKEAISYYQQRQTGLGYDFIAAVESALIHITENPEIYQKV